MAKNCLRFLILALLSPALTECLSLIHHGRIKDGFLGSPPIKEGSPLPPDQWFTQRLNHFNDADLRTWQQRYFVNGTFFKLGGPVFLMIGGEGTASPAWMVEGSWIVYAQQFNALCLQLEHRFYGKSHPTSDLSVDNLAYLSSEQALADIANFRSYIADSWGLQKNKWIAFGGSYPGSLAAWVRLKFPHLIDGSVATSAPIQAQLNFKEYLGVVRDALDTTGASCNPAIAEATAAVQDLLTSSAGAAKLKQMFRLCDDVDITNEKDVANLYSTLAGNFENVVQYNKDNRAFEGARGTNVTIDVLCRLMSDASRPALERYAAVNALILDTYSTKCVDFKYDSMIRDLRAVHWNDSAAEGGRQWIYQTCTEFGYYQSSDLDKQPFGHGFDLKFAVDQCADIYGPRFSRTLIEAGINRTNINYGGYGLRLTRVVFPNGSIDPWHALGITRDLSPEATAIYIKGTAHCANMYPETPEDPPQLREARRRIGKLIGLWLQQ